MEQHNFPLNFLFVCVIFLLHKIFCAFPFFNVLFL